MRGMTRCGNGVRCLGIAVALLATAAGPAGAAVVEEVRFAESVRIAGREVPLRGVGLLRYRWVIRAYVAALYLPEDVRDPLADAPRRLEIEYFWSLDAGDIARAGETLLERNVDPATLERIRPQVERMNELYVDIEPGDRYALTYAPGRGTELSKNGRTLGRVPGAEFAAAYFSIWLGEEPLDTGLRADLLGQ